VTALKAIGCSRAKLYRWKRHLRELGACALADRCRRPHQVRQRQWTAAKLELSNSPGTVLRITRWTVDLDTASNLPVLGLRQRFGELRPRQAAAVAGRLGRDDGRDHVSDRMLAALAAA